MRELQEPTAAASGENKGHGTAREWGMSRDLPRHGRYLSSGRGSSGLLSFKAQS
jgi:hypothetical protein